MWKITSSILLYAIGASGQCLAQFGIWLSCYYVCCSLETEVLIGIYLFNYIIYFSLMGYKHSKKRQRSSQLFGGQSLFNSLPRQLFCRIRWIAPGWFEEKYEFILFFKIVLVQIACAAKNLIKSEPQNQQRRLLPFLLSLSFFMVIRIGQNSWQLSSFSAWGWGSLSSGAMKRSSQQQQQQEQLTTADNNNNNSWQQQQQQQLTTTTVTADNSWQHQQLTTTTTVTADNNNSNSWQQQ